MTLIFRAHKARHVRLNHELLLRHSLCLQLSDVHHLVMSDAEQAPCGDALRQGEFYLHVALVVGLKTGHEESRLRKVLANSHVAHFCCFSLILHRRFFCATNHHAIHAAIHRTRQRNRLNAIEDLFLFRSRMSFNFHSLFSTCLIHQHPAESTVPGNVERAEVELSLTKRTERHLSITTEVV